MDPITSQMKANPMTMANPTGGMQQMPFGPVPGGQVPVARMGNPAGMTPPPPPQPMNIQGALSQFQQSPIYQNNPMLQQMVAQRQGNLLFQQLQQNPAYQNMFMPNFSGVGSTPRPETDINRVPDAGYEGRMFPDRFAEMQQRMMAMQPPQYGMPRPGGERDQYGNPIAAPVLYDRQMPGLMQRYRIM